MADYETVSAARDRADRVVLVGENDHYKPLAVCLRQLLADGVIGEMVFAHFVSLAKRLKAADDWRNDETMAGGDAFFEEGIHWLHLAASLGPRIVDIHGFRPSVSRAGTDRRAKSMMVAFRYDNDAVGSLYYSREIPSLLRGLRLSKLLGRDGDYQLRVERAVHPGARQRPAASGHPWIPRHARVPGDVSRLRARHSTETRAGDEP